jgi:hypothetical protein
MIHMQLVYTPYVQKLELIESTGAGASFDVNLLRVMPKTLDPFRFLLFAVAGWMNQKQQHAVEYLREERRSGNSRDLHSGRQQVRPVTMAQGVEADSLRQFLRSGPFDARAGCVASVSADWYHATSNHCHSTVLA